MEWSITTGILVCLFGTFLGGIFSLVARGRFLERAAQAVLLASLGIGFVTSGVFLASSLHPIAFAGVFFLDRLSAIFFFLVNAVGFLAVWYGARYILNEKDHYNLAHVQCLTAIFLLGMQAVVLVASPIFFLFAWEIMSFSSFLLVIADRQSASVRPAIFYLIMTHLGAGALLAGFLLLSHGAVDVIFSDVALFASSASTPTLLAAFLLFFFGFGSKAGLFPFHGWLPEAHPQAPSHISALMSGVMLKIAVYGFLRVMLFIFPSVSFGWGIAVTVVGLFSAIFGVLYSITETDVKRILAFSSIENLGLIFSMIGIAFSAHAAGSDILAGGALFAALFQSVCHAFFKSGLFFSAGIMGQTFHTRNIEKMGGMAKYMKIFSFATLVLTLTAAALPPSGVFMGEWIFIQSLLKNIASVSLPFQATLLFVLVVFGAVAGMAVFSMVRFFGIAFLAEPRTPEAKIKKDPASALLLPVVIAGAIAFLSGPLAPQVENMLMPAGDVSFSYFTFDPLFLLLLLAIVAFLAFLARRVFSNAKNEREYHTWNCGQPIDASMEYTGTAFSAPIRFFFNMLLRVKKKVTQTRVTPENPWIVQKSVTIERKPIWDTYFYNPVVRSMEFFSISVRRLQNGNIQFYISLVLLTLIFTAIVIL